MRGAAEGGAGQDRADPDRARRQPRRHRPLRRRMTLRAALDEVGAGIDRAFDRLLPIPRDARARLYEAMRYAAIGGGKRIRPMLVAAACDLFKVDRGRAMRVALAVECIHVYSLIHDDLPSMDDDDLRRGKPTLHRAFEESTAILA